MLISLTRGSARAPTARDLARTARSSMPAALPECLQNTFLAKDPPPRVLRPFGDEARYVLRAARGANRKLNRRPVETDESRLSTNEESSKNPVSVFWKAVVGSHLAYLRSSFFLSQSGRFWRQGPMAVSIRVSFFPRVSVSFQTPPIWTINRVLKNHEACASFDSSIVLTRDTPVLHPLGHKIRVGNSKVISILAKTAACAPVTKRPKDATTNSLKNVRERGERSATRTASANRHVRESCRPRRETPRFSRLGAGIKRLRIQSAANAAAHPLQRFPAPTCALDAIPKPNQTRARARA